MVEDRVEDLNSVVFFKYTFTTVYLILMKTVKYKTKNDLTKEQ